MTDLVKFLTARLDERERFARNAEHAVGTKYDPLVVSAGETLNMGLVMLYRESDPARVLAKVEANRRILAEHKHIPAVQSEYTHHYDFGCQTCHVDTHCSEIMGLGWCETVRLMATVYDQSPDYDPAWKVS